MESIICKIIDDCYYFEVFFESSDCGHLFKFTENKLEVYDKVQY